MRKLLLRWVILAVSLVISAHVTSLLLPGFQLLVGSFGGVLKLFVGVALLTLLNATLGRVIKLFTLPLNCMTLGLVSLVVNAAMLELAGAFEFGFKVENFGAAFVGSLLLSAINGLLGAFVRDDEE